MKLFTVARVSMPMLVLGAAFAFAPQSRAQEVAPDQFAIAPNAPASASNMTPAAAEKPASPATLHANKKPATRVTPANSAKNVSPSQKPELLAVQDKRKIPASKANKQ